MMTLENNCCWEGMRGINITMEKETPYDQGKGGNMLCPNVHKPFEDCYCASTSSLFAEATIHYCGGRYQDCEIYARHTKKGGDKI